MNRRVGRTCDDTVNDRASPCRWRAYIAGPLWRSQRRRMSSAHRAARNESCVSIWRLHALIPYAQKRGLAVAQEARSVAPSVLSLLAFGTPSSRGSAHGAAAPSHHTHAHTRLIVLPPRNMAGSQRTTRRDGAVLTVFVLFRANNVSLRRSSVARGVEVDITSAI